MITTAHELPEDYKVMEIFIRTSGASRIPGEDVRMFPDAKMESLSPQLTGELFTDELRAVLDLIDGEKVEVAKGWTKWYIQREEFEALTGLSKIKE